MTTITPIDSNSKSGDAQSSPPVKILGKDDFLNMLIAQLQHQDPLNPTDSTEFTAQLAQFSSLEQLSNINDSLQNMEQFQASLIDSQAVSYIGKEITAKGNSIQLENGRPVECHFELGANAALVVISIYDASGDFVTSFETGPLNSGRQLDAWNGMDMNGNSASPGFYRFEVQALDTENESLSVTPLISSVVTGVSFKNQAVSLITGLQTVAIDDVIDVSQAMAPSVSVETNSETNSNEQLNGGN
jgi:flagellar basal-body rod modification protein FlgD